MTRITGSRRGQLIIAFVNCSISGTFNVMKECISETDHYQRFPDKGYPLDEECDLVDVQGQEVAYCVCRQSLCNREPVADQFMGFEEVLFCISWCKKHFRSTRNCLVNWKRVQPLLVHQFLRDRRHSQFLERKNRQRPSRLHKLSLQPLCQ